MVQECWADPDLADVGILGIPVSQSKRIRALPFVARGEAGKLFLVRGEWNDSFIDECLEFDTGDFDDQVDAGSGVIHMLAWTGANITDLNDALTDDDEDTGTDIETEQYFSAIENEEEELIYG